MSADPRLVGGLRRLMREPRARDRRRASGPGPGTEPDTTCELCPVGIGEQHRHLIHLAERRIVCVCATCWALRSGDGDYRRSATGSRGSNGFVLTDEQWRRSRSRSGSAFFMISSVSGSVIALYPSPRGDGVRARPARWAKVCAANPGFELEPDAEALIVNRLGGPPQCLIAPIDAAYGLVGVVKASWEGISAGAVERRWRSTSTSSHKRQGVSA